MQANDASAKARQAPERRAGEGRRCGLANICEPIMRRLPIFASKVIPALKTTHALDPDAANRASPLPRLRPQP
jgi:hypothetical protein